MRYILLLIIFLFPDVHGQSWYIKRNIVWSVSDNSLENKNIKDALSFSFAEFDDPENDLPVYTDVIDWYEENPSVKIQLFSAQYEVLPDKFKNEIVFSGLEEEVEIKSHISRAGKKPFLVISIIPFRKNITTGNIERLTNFVLEIESEKIDLSAVSHKKLNPVDNSVLANGTWYKIRIPSTGIYKLSYDQLKSIGLADPASTRIFGSGGHMLPEDIRKGEKDDLSPLGFYMNKGSDGIFGPGDFILFYGTGPENWSFESSSMMYRCRKNIFSDFGYYFLTSDNGTVDIIEDSSEPAGPVTHIVNQYDYYNHHELNEENLIKSGKEYYGEAFFDNSILREFQFNIPELIITSPVKVTTNVLSRSSDSAIFILSANGKNIETFRLRPTSISNYTSIFAYNQQKTSSFLSDIGNLSLQLRYIKREPKANGWLDFITLSARSELRFQGNSLAFRDQKSVASNAVTSFTIENAEGNIIIWDVTNPNGILNMPLQADAGKITFTAGTAILKQFIAFRTNGEFPAPEFSGKGLGKIENQNLHGISTPELLIISHADFISQANRLAQHRSLSDNITVYVTTPEKIYNEFSSGAPDVTSIRNFAKSLYDRGMNEGGDKLNYLLLFGGGSYDNKGVMQNAGNFILTYQSDNSLSPISSYVSDDYFALLDPGEQMFDGMLDIGVGRFPVTNSLQAETVVDKIMEYESPSSMGVWRNSLCFIGDDEDNNIHFNQSNQLANNIISNYPSFNVNKIFLDAYKKQSTPVGQRYPDVKMAINEQVARGALIVNYTGHGGVEGLAHERILEINDIYNWRNKGKYPLFLTATCEFTRFDDPAKVSAGEEVFLNPQGGGIALFSTTRLVYSGPNQVLNERFYEIVFNTDSENKNYRLGDIMKYSKNRTGSGINKRNFSLIGDPSMKLAYPRHKIITDSINFTHVSEPLDTLKALSKVTVSGHVNDIQGNFMHSLDGLLYPVVYDKPVQLTTMANDGGDKKSFTVQNSILYKGKVSIDKGNFTFTFLVPKDINYALGEGRLSYYGHDSLFDAAGSFRNFIIGSSSENFNLDNEGPVVDVYMNNENFRSGDVTDTNPVLFVKVRDESGINTAGNGIGHNISAVLNNNSSSPFNLNEYFEAELNSYNSGIVKYPLYNLEEGRHLINLKVWDIHNNSGDGYVEFIVAKSEEFFLNEIFNYPNPFSDKTWFSFGHNKAGTDLVIKVDIFNTSGELVKTIKTKEFGSGFRSQPLEWDGKSDGGLNNKEGIYIYRISVISSDGQSAVKSGKLLIIR